jgi:NAD-dependent DNA ligase
LATVIASFSIPLVGGTASKKICAAVINIDEITFERCRQAGLGEKVSQNLVGWLETEFLEVREFLPFSFTSQQVPIQSGGKSVCITGKLSSFKTKSEAYKALEEAGFKVTETVTKSTDYLVDEDNKGSSKRKKADELGITIIQNLNTFLKEKQND